MMAETADLLTVDQQVRVAALSLAREILLDGASTQDIMDAARWILDGTYDTPR